MATKITSTVAVNSNLRLTTMDTGKAQLSFTVASTTDCWNLYFILTQAQYAILKASGQKLSLNGFRTNNMLRDIAYAGPFLSDSQVVISSTNELSQGYAAFRYPASSADESYVTGGWTAQLSGSSDLLSQIDVSKIVVRLVERQIIVPQSAAPLETFVLPLRFVIVAPQEKLAPTYALLGQARSYFRAEVFDKFGLQVREVEAVAKEVSTKTMTSDLRQGDMAALVAKYANANYLTIFAVVNITFFQLTALGFAMVPGPQGFVSSHNAVIIRIRPDSMFDSPGTVGARIGHETGHYLGLLHESSCLDNNKVGRDIDTCRATLKDQSSSRAKLISGNLMYTGTPGRRLNGSQNYQLLRAPVVKRTVSVPRTVVRKLVVKVHTGLGVRDWSDVARLDFAGTDDNVSFTLLDRLGNILSSNNVNSGHNDFEAGTNWDYQLEPPPALFEEDIFSFIISKSFNIFRIGLVGDDHWKLQGLEVRINDRVWYSDDNINTWLANDHTSPDSFHSRILRPTSTSRRIGEPPPTPPSPSFVTPPFVLYPISLSFGGQKGTIAASDQNWNTVVGSPSHLSFQAWIQPTNQTDEQAIVSAGDNQNRIFLRIKAGKYQAGCTVAGVEAVASAQIPPDDLNRWIHLCAAYDGAAWMIHRNGDSMATQPGASLPVIARNIWIGGYETGGGAFNGRIRNVCLWKVNRSAAQELEDLFRIDPLGQDVAAYWPLNEGDGSTAYDASEEGHDLQITNPVWYVPPLMPANALFLPAELLHTPTFVTATGAKLTAAFTTSDLTVCGWFRSSPSSTTTWERVLASTNDLVLRIRNGSYEFGLASVPTDLLAAPIPAGDLGTWVHLAGQYDATSRSWRLFRNGHQLKQQAATQGYVIPPPGTSWTFGGRANAPTVPGSLEFRKLCLFHGVVSISRLRSAYMPATDGVAQGAASDGLVAYWPVDDGAGGTIFDITTSSDDPTGAHGTFDSSAAMWTVVEILPSMAFVAQGESLNKAINAIGDASPNKLYTIFLGPGVFPGPIVLRQYISLIGAGEGTSEITMPASNDPVPTLEIRGQQILAQVTVSNTGPGGFGANYIAIGFYTGTDAFLINVTIRAIQTSKDGNCSSLSINGAGGMVTPANRINLRNCTITADRGASFNVVQMFGGQMNMVGCTVSGALIGMSVINLGKCTLSQCTIRSTTALLVDRVSSIIAQGCQISGIINGNVKVVSSP